jgi:hypothetical protein
MSKKRLTRLYEIGIRARCGPEAVTGAIHGTYAKGWDVPYLLARYRKFYGKPLKIETLYRIYNEEKARAAAREPAHISPSLRARLDKLGDALSKVM